MQYWLLKTEPSCFSINDLASLPGQTTAWDGVRNYQARNMLRDGMQKGDQALFYHSVTGVGVAGLCEVVRAGYPDPTQWDPAERHFDPASSVDTPRWYAVDIKLVRVFPQILPLALLRGIPELADMALLQKGSRLSVQPVTPAEFSCIIGLVGA